MIRHNRACIVTSVPCSRTSLPADLPDTSEIIRSMCRYKWCFVPKCTNTSVSTPSKEFFHVPMKKNVRSNWFKAARREMNVSPKSDLYCCEDHFEVTINYFGISLYNWWVT
jgi:hypothetical protein